MSTWWELGYVAYIVGKKHHLLLLGLLLIPCWIIAAKYEIDLVVLYHTAKVTAENATEVYAQRSNNMGRFFYGPISLLLIYPMNWLEFSTLKWVWIGFQTLSYVFFWVILYRLYPSLRNWGWAWFAVWILSINPIHNNFQSNNIQLMLAAALLYAEYLTRQNSTRAQFFGGTLCSLCAMIKMFPLFIVAFYLVAKRKPTLMGVAFGMLSSVLLPLLAFGWEQGTQLFQSFFQSLVSYEADNSLTHTPDILCFPSLVARWIDAPQTAALFTKAGIILISTGFFIFSWVSIRWKKMHHRDPLHLWALALFLMAFLNPSTRPHYFIFFLPAFCSVVEMIHTKAWTLKFALFASLLLIAFTVEGVVGKSLNNQMEAWSLPTYGMILLGLALVYQLIGKRSSTVGGDVV